MCACAVVDLFLRQTGGSGLCGSVVSLPQQSSAGTGCLERRVMTEARAELKLFPPSDDVHYELAVELHESAGFHVELDL